MILFAFLVSSHAEPVPREPLPRQEIHAGSLAGLPFYAKHRLTVKFTDSTEMRVVEEGKLNSKDTALQQLISAEGLKFSPLFSMSPKELLKIERRAEKASGKSQPDLAGMMKVWSNDRSPEALERIANALQELNFVEYAHISILGVAPPGDIAPETPDFTSLQLYLTSDPGIQVLDMWAENIKGAGVRIGDIEYGWELFHEDLMDQNVTEEAGQTIPQWVIDYGYHYHGTATLGETSAVENGYGCTGIAHESEVFVFPEWSVEEDSRRANAILNAVQLFSPGDILMLEMQDYGDPACGFNYNCFVPAEINPDVWTSTRLAVDTGITVVAAAGNGDQDLDSQWYMDNYISWGDSGAIIVGGGIPYENSWGGLVYGSRVDVQAWAYDVFTLGYGLIDYLGNDPAQTYTTAFSGTSAATPIVVGAAALLQSWSMENWGQPMNPEGLRKLLKESGLPQAPGPEIGPLPQLSQAKALFLNSDADGDGWIDEEMGGWDCDDSDPMSHPDAVEIWYDGTDQNCDGNDLDQDDDGFNSAEHGGDDCEDENPDAFPGGVEVYYDGVDQNCDGLSDFDFDMDGHDSDQHSGGDCNDEDPEVNPDMPEIPYDGVDSNCDSISDYDADMDGYDSHEYDGEDCDDFNENIHPDASEIPYDGIDQNCDERSDNDADMDGHDAISQGGTDCLDNDPESHPGAEDIPNDGVDQDCDGSDARNKFGCVSSGNGSFSWVSLIFLMIALRRKGQTS